MLHKIHHKWLNIKLLYYTVLKKKSKPAYFITLYLLQTSADSDKF